MNKQQRNSARARIVDCALQVARLKGSGCYLEDGAVHVAAASNVEGLISVFQQQLEFEATTLLNLLTLSGEIEE